MIDIGPIQATRDKNHSVPLPPIIGIITLISGAALVAKSKSASKNMWLA